MSSQTSTERAVARHTSGNGSRVRRDLVHRANEEEILVSEPRRSAGGGYDSETVTDGVSPYYRDHPGADRRDVLLLIEASRQAALSAAHEFEGLSRDIAFFFNSVEVEITGGTSPAVLRDELTLHTDFEELRLRSDGTPKQIAYTQHGVDSDGRTVVRTSMAVQGVPKERYRELRAYQRDGSPAPTTVGLRAGGGRHPVPADPSRVARRRAENVVLAELRIEAGGGTALLAPDFANASLFDHDYDHYPAMVLIEAGRQLVLASTPRPEQHMVTAVRSSFAHFAELDKPTHITARHVEKWIDVQCVQDGLVVTRMSFRSAPAKAGRGEGR